MANIRQVTLLDKVVMEGLSEMIAETWLTDEKLVMEKTFQGQENPTPLVRSKATKGCHWRF